MLVYYCCYNNLPQSQVLKTTPVVYLTLRSPTRVSLDWNPSVFMSVFLLKGLGKNLFCYCCFAHSSGWPNSVPCCSSIDVLSSLWAVSWGDGPSFWKLSTFLVSLFLHLQSQQWCAETLSSFQFLLPVLLPDHLSGQTLSFVSVIFNQRFLTLSDF